jgi:ABC-2 type transport system permease protein
VPAQRCPKSRRRPRKTGARAQEQPAPAPADRREKRRVEDVFEDDVLADDVLADDVLADDVLADEDDEELEDEAVAETGFARGQPAAVGAGDDEEGAGLADRLLAGFAERPGGHWLVQVHLAVLLGLGLWPLLKMAYERLANVTLERWMTSLAGLGLAVFALVLAFLIVELIVRGLRLFNLLDVAGREYAHYYVSPTAYVLGAAFLFLIGFVFWFSFQSLVQAGPFGGQPPSLRDVQGWMHTLFLLVLPLWTMRLLAEEQRQGTIELLLTSPVRDSEVVIGKYLGALSLLMDTVALTFLYPLYLFTLGNPDPGPIIGGYLGILLYGGALLAIGLFASALTENQIIAAVISFVLYIALIFLAAVPSLAGSFIQSEALREALESLNIFEHLDGFTRGVIDSYSVVFFLSLIAVALFLATRVLETRRWR